MAPLSVQSAMAKLHHTAKTIQRRGGVKLREGKRIKSTVSLLQNGFPPDDALGAKRQAKYFNFLQKISSLCGSRSQTIVMLCAAGLGLSEIAIASDDVLVNLPYEIEKNLENFDNSVLHRLLKDYFTTPVSAPEGSNSQSEIFPGIAAQTAAPHHEQAQDTQLRESTPVHNPATMNSAHGEQEVTGLTGDVYELSSNDIKQIIVSGHISGSILLTDTYGINSTPFITIPITNELTDQLILHRPRVSWNERLS